MGRYVKGLGARVIWEGLTGNHGWQPGWRDLDPTPHDECLNETAFLSSTEAQLLLSEWQADYNTVRPHSPLANQTPEAFRTRHLALVAPAGAWQDFDPGLT